MRNLTLVTCLFSETRSKVHNFKMNLVDVDVRATILKYIDWNRITVFNNNKKNLNFKMKNKNVKLLKEIFKNEIANVMKI